jgi:aspartate-semialdehyde dehydrogenase
MHIGIVGATSLVGEFMLSIHAERASPVAQSSWHKSDLQLADRQARVNARS